MSETFVDLQSRPCPVHSSMIGPIEIDTDGDLGQALIESYSRYSLDDGEGLCCLPDSIGACRWFAYSGGAGAVAGSVDDDRCDPPSSKAAIEGAAVPSAARKGEWENSGWFDAIKMGAIITGLSLMTFLFFRSIIEAGADSRMALERPGETGIPPDQRPASFQAGQAAYDVDLSLLSESDWFRDLGQIDRLQVKMVLDDDAREALKSRHFVENYVKDGRLTEAGLRYLIDSRDGNLLGTTDLRVGHVPLRTKRPDGRELGRVMRVDALRPIGRSGVK
ncbi:MAG: hypothetical protein JXA24_05660 [Proteobacteria bacterium]|nr:hypothetical protein [Pseudomonadota bacterium]